MLGLEVNEAKQLGVATMDDFEKLHPERVSEIREWFRMYKTLDGKPENEFKEDGRLFTAEECLGIVLETSKKYRDLMKTDSSLPQR